MRPLRTDPIRYLARTALLLALTLAFQSLRLGQAFTGPLVNAALFTATAVVGIAGGVFIGAVTPWVALAVGILKPVLAPAVPFIMLGNASLVATTGLLWQRNRYLAVAAASLVKFAVLGGSVRYLLHLPRLPQHWASPNSSPPWPAASSPSSQSPCSSVPA
jgi:hypothetical protein